MDADDRAFVHELLLRHEKATDTMLRDMRARTDVIVRRVDAGTEALKRHTDQFVRQMEAQRRQMEAQRREFVDESRAQRAALFRILDRLDEGGSAAGA